MCQGCYFLVELYFVTLSYLVQLLRTLRYTVSTVSMVTSRRKCLPSSYPKKVPVTASVGSFSNDDGEGNAKTAMGLLSKTTTFSRASRFFVHFFAVTARLRREIPDSTLYGGRKQATTNFSFSF